MVAALRRELAPWPVPDPDPLDGGDRASLLLLLETPGPRIGETGFVSRDNAGGTAGNLRRFLAPLPRETTVIWNAVPWVIHAGGPNRAPRRSELAAGLALLPRLLAALPGLRVALLCGRAAAAAAPVLQQANPALALVLMPHPSPTYVNTSPDVPRRIGRAVAEAARLAGLS